MTEPSVRRWFEVVIKFKHKFGEEEEFNHYSIEQFDNAKSYCKKALKASKNKDKGRKFLNDNFYGKGIITDVKLYELEDKVTALIVEV